jgi:hypothetical protein
MDDVFAASSPVSDSDGFEFESTSDDGSLGHRMANSDPYKVDFWDVPPYSRRPSERRVKPADSRECGILEGEDLESEGGAFYPPLDNVFEDYGDCDQGDTPPAFTGDSDVETASAYTIESHDQSQHIPGLLEPHDRACNIDRSHWKATFAPGSERPFEFEPNPYSGLLEDIFAEAGEGVALVPLGLSGQELGESHILSPLPCGPHDYEASFLEFNAPFTQGFAPETHSTPIDGIFGL